MIGGYGGHHLKAGTGNDSTPTDFRCGLIMPYEDCTFSVLTQAEDQGAKINGQALTGEVWPAGVPIGGDFTAITISTGRCICYEFRGQEG